MTPDPASSDNHTWLPVRPLRQLISLQIGIHACMTGVRMAAPLMILQAQQPAWLAGLILALFGLAPVFLGIPAGRLVDRHGFHRPFKIGAGLVMIGALLGAVASLIFTAKSASSGPHWYGLGWVLLAASAICCGAGANVGSIATQRTGSRIASAQGINLIGAFSWIGLAPSASGVIGQLITGILIDLLGFTGTLLIIAIFPFLALYNARVVPVEFIKKPSDNAKSSSQTTTRRLVSLLLLPGVLPLIAVNWAMSASWDLHTLLVPMLGHERSLNASQIGSILAAFSISIVAVRGLITRVSAHLDGIRTLKWAMLWVGCMLAVYPLNDSYLGMLLCAILLGLPMATVQPLILTTLHHLTPEHEQGQAIALRSTLMNLSGSVMPLLFGMISTAWGSGPVFWIMAGVVVLVTSQIRKIQHPLNAHL